MLVKAIVRAIVEDEIFKTPIVILEQVNTSKYLPIWVGPFEGKAIEYGIKGNQLLRPLPYDTFLKTLQLLKIEMKKVIINELRSTTFYAIIVMEGTGGEVLEIDSRPSDAIAMAVRSSCPIFINDRVMKNAQAGEEINKLMEQERKRRGLDTHKDDENDENDKNWLDNINPEDFK